MRRTAVTRARRYNAKRTMHNPHYALVAYVRHPVGEFIERLRRELHPELPHLPAHITILPPRILSDLENVSAEVRENRALELLGQMCREVDPFEVVLGDVETFVPITPTDFIRVAHGAYRLRELHDRLNTGMFFCSEQWPYMPHLTVIKMGNEAQAMAAFHTASERWGQYAGSRRIAIEEVTFVREANNNSWVDLAPVHLGRTRVSETRK
ncbi:MAG: 2'-5' RNA ligase family protein [Acidobacteria bacterium]|nr:2'-5' RNA ligase family protein [Acidobacteriota bacterium]